MITQTPSSHQSSRRPSHRSRAHLPSPRMKSETIALPEFAVSRIPPGKSSEIIDGLWYRFPRESKHHLGTCERIEKLLKEHLSCSLEQVFTKRDGRPLCSSSSTLYPDFWVSTLARNPTLEQRVAYPGLVIEVVSPTREKVDRGAKLRAYRSINSVQEILLIDPIKLSSEHYVRIDGNQWRFSDVPSGVSVNLESIGFSIQPIEGTVRQRSS